MLTGALKNKVDSIWEMFWTGGITNPLDVVEQMTYLMFIHDLDETDAKRAKSSMMLELPYTSMFEGHEEYKWSCFRDYPAERMYELMQGEIFPFIKNLHGSKESTYAKYMSDAIFKIPTPQLLSKIVDAIDEMYQEMAKEIETDTKGDVYESLLSKLATAGVNGQFRTPRHIKSVFYIFDFCGNFAFFRMNKKGKEGFSTQSVQERIFNLKTELVFRLQGLEYQTEELIAFRSALIDDLVAKIGELNRDNFAVRQHLRYVDQYSKREGYEALSYENTLQIAEEIAPLILPYEDDASAVRFDALMYGLELAYILGKTYSKARNDLVKMVYAVSKVATIPAVSAKSELISKILNTDYVDNAGINEFEHIRTELRDIMKYIPRGERPIYQTDFTDDVLSVERHESELDSDELQNYRNKVNYYIRQHLDDYSAAFFTSFSKDYFLRVG